MTTYEEDEHLISQILAGDQKVLSTLYFKMKEIFISYMMREYKLERFGALQCYGEAFTTFYLNIRNGKLMPPLRSSLKTYLFSIGKFSYLSARRQSQKVLPLNPSLSESLITGPEKIVTKENAQWVRQLLNKLGDPCKAILTAFFIKGFSAESVALNFGLSNESAARKRKFDCLKKIRKLMSE